MNIGFCLILIGKTISGGHGKFSMLILTVADLGFAVGGGGGGLEFSIRKLKISTTLFCFF